jgi:cytoskeletal protein CcmA (bactofilin family)
MSSDDGLIIDGHLECTTAQHDKHITVGEFARVKANIQARTVVILGELIGDITSGGKVLLANCCDVKGNIFCRNVFIEEGASFQGEINMEDVPEVDVTLDDPAPPRPTLPKSGRPYVAKPAIYA